MFETAILFLFGISAIFATVYNLKKLDMQVSIKDIPRTILSYGIVIPLLEESLFRSVLKQYLTELYYANYINAILFGLLHTTNYMIHKNVLLTIFQVISTTYLGYYVVQYESFLYALLTHSIYNMTIASLGYAIYILYYNRVDKSCTEFNTLFPFSITYPIKTQDDLSITTPQKYIPTHNFCPRNKINKEMLQRIDKLQIIENKRYSMTNNITSSKRSN